MSDFNIREFFRESRKQVDEEFQSRMGLPLRSNFQCYDSGSGKIELFAIKSRYGAFNECYGYEYEDNVGYLCPVNEHAGIVFIYDTHLVGDYIEICSWNETKQRLFAHHAPNFMSAAFNSLKFESDKPVVFVEEGMLGFGKRIDFNKEEIYTEEGRQKLLLEIMELCVFRMECTIEVASFYGFTPGETAQIMAAKGLNMAKNVVQNLNFSDIARLIK